MSGHVIFLLNKRTQRATPLSWSSKKIERVVSSSLGAETIGVTKLIGSIYYIKEILKQMHGNKAGDIPCIAMTDSKDLYEAVHNIKHPQDKKLIGDIYQIKQAIAIEKLITELRLIKGSEMLANSLTKGGANADDLMKVLRSGTLVIPGGNVVKDAKKIHSSTWQKLLQAQTESFRSMFG